MSHTGSEEDDINEKDQGRVSVDGGKVMSNTPLTHEEIEQRAGPSCPGTGDIMEEEQVRNHRPPGLFIPSTPPTELGAGGGLSWGGPA